MKCSYFLQVLMKFIELELQDPKYPWSYLASYGGRGIGRGAVVMGLPYMPYASSMSPASLWQKNALEFYIM